MIENSFFERLQQKLGVRFIERDCVFDILQKYIHNKKQITIKNTTIFLQNVSSGVQKEIMFQQEQLIEKIKEITKKEYRITFK